MKCKECDFNRNGFCESYDGTTIQIINEDQDCIYMNSNKHESKCPYCGKTIIWSSYISNVTDCDYCGRPFDLEKCRYV